MSIVRIRGLLLACGVVGLMATMSGCASLPSSGPTAHEVLKRASGSDIGIKIVEVTAPVVAEAAAADQAADARQPTLVALARNGSNDRVGPGDVLAISIFEVGANLFGGQSVLAGNMDPSAKNETFPSVVVDRDGDIQLPYIGSLAVAGRTPTEIGSMIVQAYKGKSQSPQALVSVRDNLSEATYVSGDVRRPGRIVLSLQNERLLDAIALAGGPVTQTQDMVVRFTRGGRSVEERLDRIVAGAPDDLTLVTGDRIELIREPQTFVVLGATTKVSQVPFNQTDLTLAEAIARAGGPNDAAADPRAVFLFRYEPPATVGGQPIPVIYQLDMMNPASYFLAQRFAMRNKDVLYISNAGINRTAKFVSIINQLFSPFVAARAISGN